MKLDEIKEFLSGYDGPEINIMEVCGSHTGAIAKNGIPGMLSDKIHLLSGPGCPVCVTPSSYVDRLIELSLTPGTAVATFGDLIRVPGSERSLSEAKGEGARVIMLYSPLDILALAEKEPQTTFVFAAVGFETTTPVYALLMDQLVSRGVNNVKLLTAIKTMPEVIDYLMANGAEISGFLAPGHVSVVTGADVFKPLADKYQMPFAVAGFKGTELLVALAGLVKQIGCPKVMNFYPQVVTASGNQKALALIDRYFEPADAVWRGLGTVAGSGRVLRAEFSRFDAGSAALSEDVKVNKACCCDRVLMGRMKPTECPLFGRVCTPIKPQGACMVSTEGSCHSWFVNHRT